MSATSAQRHMIAAARYVAGRVNCVDLTSATAPIGTVYAMPIVTGERPIRVREAAIYWPSGTGTGIAFNVGIYARLSNSNPRPGKLVSAQANAVSFTAPLKTLVSDSWTPALAPHHLYWLAFGVYDASGAGNTPNIAWVPAGSMHAILGHSDSTGLGQWGYSYSSSATLPTWFPSDAAVATGSAPAVGIAWMGV